MSIRNGREEAIEMKHEYNPGDVVITKQGEVGEVVTSQNVGRTPEVLVMVNGLGFHPEESLVRAEYPLLVAVYDTDEALCLIAKAEKYGFQTTGNRWDAKKKVNEEIPCILCFCANEMDIQWGCWLGEIAYTMEWMSDFKQIIAWLEYNAEEEKTWDEPAPRDEEWREALRRFLYENKNSGYEGPSIYELGLENKDIGLVLINFTDVLLTELKVIKSQLEATQDRKNELMHKINRIKSATEFTISGEHPAQEKIHRVVKILYGDDTE